MFGTTVSAKPYFFRYALESMTRSMNDDDARSVVSSSARYSSDGDAEESGRFSLTRLSKSIFGLLSTDALITTKDHILAATKLQNLVEALRHSDSIPQKLQIELVCVSTSLLRRVVKLRCKSEPSIADSQDEVDFCRTLTLVFVAIVAADLVARNGVPADESVARQLQDMNRRTTWEQLCKHSKRRQVADEIDELEKQRMQLEMLVDCPFFTDDERGSWTELLAQPGSMAAAALARGGQLLAAQAQISYADLQTLAFEFVRATVAQMHFQLLRHECGDSDRSFVTLSTHRFVEATNNIAGNCRDDHIETIISAGESEIGQSVLRDLLTSFLVPKEILGTRRSLMLSREIGERVSTDLPWVAAMAHETAMAGCAHTYSHSRSELKRACALLTGLAILTTPGKGEDQGRKSVAFNGLVQLPFLETAPETINGKTFLALIPASRSWALYKIPNSGKPDVLHSQRGLEGLICTVLGLRDVLFKKTNS